MDSHFLGLNRYLLTADRHLLGVHRRLLRALVLLAMFAAFPGGVHAQTFVDDTRAMTSNGSWNDLDNCYIGGSASDGNGGFSHDSQLADVFQVVSQTRLTGVTVDTIETTPGAGMPTGGFLVEIFANLAGNHPAETPTFSLLVPPASCTFDGLFGNTTSPVPPGSQCAGLPGDRATWSVNLIGGNIVLGPGTWWISVTPKNDGDPFGCTFQWVGSNATLGVARAHWRCGGIDHGNGYPCDGSSGNTHSNWVPEQLTNFAFNPGTLSRRIEGNVQCAADFNGVNGVNVQDIFDFLAAWFSGNPASDFNHTGGIGVQDIFDFLAAWFAGC